MDLISFVKAKRYTDETVIGAGALKGVPCEVENIIKKDGANIVTFKWEKTDGTVKTSDMEVEDGLSISKLEVDAEGKLVATLSDGSKLTPVDMPAAQVEVSKEEGNAAELKEDGIYVPKSSAGGTDADSVSYENATYPAWDNVKKAIDGILGKIDYVKPSITSFSATPSTTVYEIGQKIASIVFKWTTNKDIKTQTLTGCTLEDETVRTATYDQEISSNKTFTLSISDGENTDSKSFSVAFQNKVYSGSKALPDSFDSEFILGLSTSKFSTTKAGTYNVNVATDEYAFIAYPKSFGQITSAKIGGFDTDLINCGDVSFTNASGYTTTYNIVRTGRSGLGSISMVVS